MRPSPVFYLYSTGLALGRPGLILELEIKEVAISSLQKTNVVDDCIKYKVAL